VSWPRISQTVQSTCTHHLIHAACLPCIVVSHPLVNSAVFTALNFTGYWHQRSNIKCIIIIIIIIIRFVKRQNVKRLPWRPSLWESAAKSMKVEILWLIFPNWCRWFEFPSVLGNASRQHEGRSVGCSCCPKIGSVLGHLGNLNKWSNSRKVF